MPKRTDIEKILIIGSGPIVIGQACEFDYSGTQACKALKEEGYKIILINSNPATIMTDPDFADSTYIEPLTVESLKKIIEIERPDAILPTMGGQTALNLSMRLFEEGVLEKYGVEMIGANYEAINKSEDRDLFKQAMTKIGLSVPESGYANSLDDALKVMETMDYPVIIRPSFTLGGSGANIAYNREEFEQSVRFGLDSSPCSKVLIEESLIGWKEFELEVMRDVKDNVVIICSIENFDPMGIHTGDSITVAPVQTLSDKEYQMMRDASIDIIREIGVDTGGSNIQFALNPANGTIQVIEMNPRVSRSSALASKATGFPIARIAAKLAVGYTLDEIPNDITKKTPASFEPTIDYVVVKIPRFTFEKFSQTDETLTTQMKSVGEVMAIGRTFKESLQKAMRSLEIGSYGFESKINHNDIEESDKDLIMEKLKVPNWERLWYIGDAINAGFSINEIHELSNIDKWFLYNIGEIIDFEETLKDSEITSDILRKAKELGFSDRRIGKLAGISEEKVGEYKEAHAVEVVYKTVDTCGAEFEAFTPYLYATYEKPYYKIESGELRAEIKDKGSKQKMSNLVPIPECEANPTDKKKVMILGSGPNRIGQGIEFDYCCVHASFALKDDGYETIMVNCNPETVSTDYDTSDRLYFEPLTFEDVMNIVKKENPYGVILQFGGQTPLKLAVALEKAGVNILGTSPDSIDRAEDRERFDELLKKLSLRRPDSGLTRSIEEAKGLVESIGFPVMVRPSYVLGGRAMQICHDMEGLKNYVAEAVKVSPEHPVLIDKFLENAIEVDVDAISDGTEVVIGGVMEHIEEAGVHSGDSACSLPPYSIKDEIRDELIRQTKALAKELRVVGLMNVQFAIRDNDVYLIEVNPRASRTIPFVSKAIGVPLAKLAARIMMGKSLKDLGFTTEIVPPHVSVKEAVFPFIKFPGVDTILGPEMKSTGEVMGIDKTFGEAFAKAQIAAGNKLPSKGRVFISVRNEDKKAAFSIAKDLSEAGFEIIATRGTAQFLRDRSVACETVNKVFEGRPHIVDRIKSGDIAMVINTPFGLRSRDDSYSIRRTTLVFNVPYFTTVAGAKAATQGIISLMKKTPSVQSLQKHLKELQMSK
ncbi:MAG: carbamoyl-phosphate synthase large subunit [Thermodesulfobacteriota bacterium]